jgi:hypothetical protein
MSSTLKPCGALDLNTSPSVDDAAFAVRRGTSFGWHDCFMTISRQLAEFLGVNRQIVVTANFAALIKLRHWIQRRKPNRHVDWRYCICEESAGALRVSLLLSKLSSVIALLQNRRRMTLTRALKGYLGTNDKFGRLQALLQAVGIALEPFRQGTRDTAGA